MIRFRVQTLWTTFLACVMFLCCAIPATADPNSYRSDLAAFFKHLDTSYPFFDLKGIRVNWEATQATLTAEVETCGSDTEFLKLVQQAIGALHDSHVGFRESKVELPRPAPRYYPGLSFMPATEQRVAVMWASDRYAETLSPGTIITMINGQNARTYLDEAAVKTWDAGFQPSHQRARLFAYRIPLQDARGKEHTLSYIDGEIEKSVRLVCNDEARGWPHTYNLPDNLTKVGRSYWYSALSENVGYMYLRRIDGSIVEGIDAATAAHPAVRGWIVDLCGNAGGGYGQDLIDRIKGLSRPVAVIIDAGCVSAGETVARDFRRYADAKLYGTTTAGSSSSKQTWTFPSGIASLTLPTRSRWRADGKPIEFNGIEPDVRVEPDPADIVAGKNSAIARALADILSVESLPIRRPE